MQEVALSVLAIAVGAGSIGSFFYLGWKLTKHNKAIDEKYRRIREEKTQNHDTRVELHPSRGIPYSNEVEPALVYYIGMRIVGAVAFVLTWLYAIASWGFLIGVSLGWFPAMIVGTIAGYLWPLVLIALIGFALMLFGGQ